MSRVATSPPENRKGSQRFPIPGGGVVLQVYTKPGSSELAHVWAALHHGKRRLPLATVQVKLDTDRVTTRQPTAERFADQSLCLGSAWIQLGDSLAPAIAWLRALGVQVGDAEA